MSGLCAIGEEGGKKKGANIPHLFCTSPRYVRVHETRLEPIRRDSFCLNSHPRLDTTTTCPSGTGILGSSSESDPDPASI